MTRSVFPDAVAKDWERAVILEGVVTTRNVDGTINVAPMGPIFELPIQGFLFRPFQTSTTYQNLKREGCGVFHITDDVLLIAQAALGQLVSVPPTIPATQIAGAVLEDCCRWYEFVVETLDDSQARTEITTRIVHAGQRREFLGFNRAKHAVLEGAILATRLHLLSNSTVRAELDRMAMIVEKTAGRQEQEAFGLIVRYVEDYASETHKFDEV
ncbi:MAG: DUF447 family protein [Planctomycetaceae bacterium]